MWGGGTTFSPMILSHILRLWPLTIRHVCWQPNTKDATSVEKRRCKGNCSVTQASASSQQALSGPSKRILQAIFFNVLWCTLVAEAMLRIVCFTCCTIWDELKRCIAAVEVSNSPCSVRCWGALTNLPQFSVPFSTTIGEATAGLKRMQAFLGILHWICWAYHPHRTTSGESTEPSACLRPIPDKFRAQAWMTLCLQAAQ
jgi:hypothetical protein